MSEQVKLCEAIRRHDMADISVAKDYFEALRLCMDDDQSYAISNAKWLYGQINQGLRAAMSGNDLEKSGEWYELKKYCTLLLAPHSFDHFLQYLEWDRPPEKKFWLPRRKKLMRLCNDLQDLEDRVIDFLGISLPPRVGKTTLCIFFMLWHMSKYPDDANVMSGHSDKLTDGIYKELVTILKDDVTYRWADVFPNIRVESVSAKNETINLVHAKRFPTMTCRSIEGTLTGAVEIGENGILYVDDLVKDLEESLSPERMQAKYDAYLNTLKDRKKDGARELMVGTRWNVLDPLGRIAAQYADNPRYRFTVIPALNEDGESNFEYEYGVGFTTKYYIDMKASIDDASWWAKYQGAPYNREGLLFPRESLLWYNGVLPDVNPDRIVAACDVAWGGGDYLSMPILYIYGSDAYMVDCVYNNGNKDVTRPLVIGKLKAHRPNQVRFEANNGGGEYADYIDGELRKENVRINISARRAPNSTSKMARIIQLAPDIQRIHFLDYEHSSQEYRKFIDAMCTFVVTGKNTNDDAPDSLAQAVDLITSNFGVVHVFKRPI